MKKIGRIFIVAFILIYTAALIYYSEEVSVGIIRSIKVCLTSIIPSLYAFMVISGFIISSDIYKLLSRPFRFAAKYILRIPEELFSVFLLSSIAGYPIGAKLITDLYKQKKIEKSIAEQMLGYCYLGGPSFFCGIAGTKIYSNAKIGLVFFLCVFISNFLIGIIFGLKNKIPACKKSVITIDLSLNKLTESIYSGGLGIIKICATIIFFSSFISILDATGFTAQISNILSRYSGISYSNCIYILKSIFEISNLQGLTNDMNLIPIVASLLSFGGLCIIVQVESIIQSQLSTNNFYFCRIVSIFLSYFCCKIVIHLMGINNIMQVNSTNIVGYRQISPIPSVFLLIMTILLLSNNYIAKSKKV